MHLTCSIILDDYNGYAEIVHATWSLHPLQVQYLHIKGHQDKNQLIQKLTKLAQYNVNCDHCAAATLPGLTPYSTQCPTHPMPSSHLIIDQKVVMKDPQGALRHAAVTPAYQSYVQTKFSWTATNATEQINDNEELSQRSPMDIQKYPQMPPPPPS